jgi:hypothetical protein
MNAIKRLPPGRHGPAMYARGRCHSRSHDSVTAHPRDWWIQPDKPEHLSSRERNQIYSTDPPCRRE